LIQKAAVAIQVATVEAAVAIQVATVEAAVAIQVATVEAAVAIPLQVVQHAVAVERVLSIGIVKEPITIVSRENKSVFCSVVEVNKSG
jgi:hypothetical protein